MTSIQQLLIKNIKRHRVRKGLSQARLAELCHVSSHYVGELETGRKFPSADTLESLVIALEIRPYQLFVDETDFLQQADPELLERFVEYMRSRLSDAVADAHQDFTHK